MRQLSKLVTETGCISSTAGWPVLRFGPKGNLRMGLAGASRMSMSTYVQAPEMPPSHFSPTLETVVNMPKTAVLSDTSSTPEIIGKDGAKTASYIMQPPAFPRILPHGYGVSRQHISAMELDVTFDPAVHLQIEPPDGVVSEDFVDVPFPMPESVKDGFNLAFSKPFRLLSDEGVRALQSVIDANQQFAKSSERIPRCLRGLAYRSNFVRDLNLDPQTIDLLSAMAGKPVAPHGMHMNMSHVNFGRPVKSGEPPVIVDQWHVDSVDYVCVVIMSDLSQSVGGDLQVLCKKNVRDNVGFLSKGVTPDLEHLVRTIQYPGKGHAIFIRGSHVLHRITPVLEALEPRVSVVNAYMSRDVFDADSTRYRTFVEQDPEHVSKVEFSRHTAWRVQGMMQYMMDEVQWGTPQEELASLMRKAAADLENAAALVNHERDDILTWIKEEGIDEQMLK